MKLKNIILFGTAVMALTACDDLIKPALENNQEITEMYNDPQFARGLIDNAFLVLPYDGSSVSDVATDDAVSNNTDNNYKKMATGNWTSEMNPINQWETRYHAIQYCNLFLENIEKVNEQTRQMVAQIEELNRVYARMVEAMKVNSQMGAK